jgi:hypothetical protein
MSLVWEQLIFECLDCHNRGLDTHGRCVSCGSDAISTPRDVHKHTRELGRERETQCSSV